jgi:hypothetical protein
MIAMCKMKKLSKINEIIEWVRQLRRVRQVRRFVSLIYIKKSISLQLLNLLVDYVLFSHKNKKKVCEKFNILIKHWFST